MPKPIVPLTVQSPGFLGLNSQNSGSVLPVGWSTKLDNFVWDDVGRLGARKGHKQTNGTTFGAITPRAQHEYIDSTGSVLNIFAAGNAIYKEVAGTITDISGTITTPTGDDWQFINFNSWCIGFQAGHTPIALTTVGGTFADSGGTQYAGVCGLSAYGRAWTCLNNVLYYSDLLTNNFTGGSSGNFDLSKYWPNGMDEAVAIADFNGFLCVFGKNSILVYESPDDTTVMNLVEGINGIGCLARDSVQTVGKEVIFLSSVGVRTLGRTIQEKSMPLTDISKNVRDKLLTQAQSETYIKSVYNPGDGFYAISLPTTGITYIFDLKYPNEDGSLKAATWDFAPTAMMMAQDETMHLCTDTGFVSTYTGYQDSVDSVGANGLSFLVDFEGVWNDFGDQASPYIKILKNVNVLASGTPGGTVNFKWAVDYAGAFTEVQLQFSTTAEGSKYGIAQYDIDTYTLGSGFETIKTPTSRSGQVVKWGLSTTIDQFSFALQRITLLAKIGKIGL